MTNAPAKIATRPAAATPRFIGISGVFRGTFVTFAALVLAAPILAQTPPPIDTATQARIDRILKATPLIDGHNDLPWEVRANRAFSVEGLAVDSDKHSAPAMTDMARLRQGRVGAQFWSVWLPSSFTGEAAIKATLEQVDVVKRLVAHYPAELELASTAADIERIHKAGRIASLIGAEGGHQIGNSLAALRAYRAAGVGYMTLTWNNNNDWADSGTDDVKHGGLTTFGRSVVAEMNRIGMIVDLSHVSEAVMTQALDATKAPVIFSHSNARALSDHPRNVSDAILKRLPANGGVVMVNAYPGHLSPETFGWQARRAAEERRLLGVYPGQPERRKSALADWDKGNLRPVTPLSVMADHIDHVAKVAGYDHVGIGADLDGVPFTVTGMESVAGYPLLFAELIRRGWSDANLAKLAGRNILRVMRGTEATAAAMTNVPPGMAVIAAAK